MAVRAHHLFTTDEYQAMFDAGILTMDDRVELLDGEILAKPVMNDPHLAAVDRLNVLLVPALVGRAIVRIQGTVKMPPRSAPEPDVALLRLVPDFWEGHHPGVPHDVYLVIEVADTSLRRDRELKMPLYARSRIREAWLVDVSARTTTVHRDPVRGRYRSVVTLSRGEVGSPLEFPDIVIHLDQVVP